MTCETVFISNLDLLILPYYQKMSGKNAKLQSMAVKASFNIILDENLFVHILKWVHVKDSYVTFFRCLKSSYIRNLKTLPDVSSFAMT